MRNHRSSRLRSAGGVAAFAAFATAGFAIGSAGQPAAGGGEASYALAPAAAPAVTAAPARLAAVKEPAPAIVATGQRRARAAAAVPASARLKTEPMSFASAEAPAPLPTTLAAMSHVLRRTSKPALPTHLAYRAAHRNFAYVPAPQPAHGEAAGDHSVQVVRRIQAEAHLFTVAQRLSAEDVAELRRAVAEAAAEGRKVKVRVERSEHSSGGGGNGFDINIQTVVKGE